MGECVCGGGLSLPESFAARWQAAKSNVRAAIAMQRQRDRLLGESVAKLAVNKPVKSDICFQSSPLSSLQQLPWKRQCHFPPLFGPLDILKAFSFFLFFFESWYIKAWKTDNKRCFSTVCMCVVTCVCVCVSLSPSVRDKGRRPSLDLQGGGRRLRCSLLTEPRCFQFCLVKETTFNPLNVPQTHRGL